MSNHYLHALPRLPLIPRFAHLRLHVTREDGHVDALTLENPLQPPGHVPCPRINGEHVHFPATTQARMNFLQQLPLLGVHYTFIEVFRFRDHKPLAPTSVWVVLRSV